MSQSDEKIVVENVNHPGYSERVNKAKYEDMRQAMLKILPQDAPGMKVADAIESLKPHLDQTLFPGGAKAGWWQKTVQLDLEAKGLIARANVKPIHLYKL